MEFRKIVEGKVRKIGCWFSLNQVLRCGGGDGEFAGKAEAVSPGTEDTAEHLGLGVGAVHPGAMQDGAVLCVGLKSWCLG